MLLARTGATPLPGASRLSLSRKGRGTTVVSITFAPPGAAAIIVDRAGIQPGELARKDSR
ncbi:hypothetical protein GCM10025759_02690 [Lysobacter panacisoli]|uniref:Uncharacterized protein n=1 Tax=Lysobacter panacisoli TaxID=1255263 RepID=A0ABP9L1E7_9GAMM